METRKHYLLLPLLLLATLALAGCKDPYGASAKAGADVASSLVNGQKTVDSLRVSGLISVQEDVQVQGILKFFLDADGAYLTCVSTAHKNGDVLGTYTACAQTFNTSLNTPAELALIHVSNPSAETQITTIISGVTSGVNLLITGLGGK